MAEQPIEVIAAEEVERLAVVAREAWGAAAEASYQGTSDQWDPWPEVVRAVLGDPRIAHALSYYARTVGFLGGRVS